jgi:ABC-type branched-subunit amino acid transport system substrate-binding protein
MFKNKTVRLAAAVAAVALVAAACSSSSKSSSSGGGKTYTVGILTDYTGPGSSSNKTSVQGVQAGGVLAKRNGYTINYVIGDTGTSPSQALSAAQKMVQQNHVFAIIAVSALTFSAAPYLTSQHIPVLGVAEDGPEWMHSANMFSAFGPVDTTKVATTFGNYFKMEGVTSLGSLGYSISPSSAEAAKGAAASAQAAGLKSGYLNANFPFGSTNVQPIAISMKNNGVNGVTASVDPNTGLQLITSFRQLGGNLKAALLPTGYGGDITQAGPGGIQAAQGVSFLTPWEPVEMNTPATRQFQADLKTGPGITTDPTYAEYAGYTSTIMLVDGLKAAGSNPTQASLITALSGIHNWNAGGLYGSRTLDLGQRQGFVLGVDNCFYVTKLQGSTFQLVPGATPICGDVVPGKTVSASS